MRNARSLDISICDYMKIYKIIEEEFLDECPECKKEIKWDFEDIELGYGKGICDCPMTHWSCHIREIEMIKYDDS